MSKVDWKSFAQINNMSHEEFGKELINTTMAFMEMELDKNKSDEMIVTNGQLNLTLKKIKSHLLNE